MNTEIRTFSKGDTVLHIASNGRKFGNYFILGVIVGYDKDLPWYLINVYGESYRYYFLVTTRMVLTEKSNKLFDFHN